MTKQERLYGELIVDFANARSTDTAAFRFFENVQCIFDFSFTFTEQAKNHFPSIRILTSFLNDPAKKLFELVSTEKKIRANLRHKFNIKTGDDDWYERQLKENILSFHRVSTDHKTGLSASSTPLVEMEMEMDETRSAWQGRRGGGRKPIKLDKYFKQAELKEIDKLIEVHSEVNQFKSSILDAVLESVLEKVSQLCSYTDPMYSDEDIVDALCHYYRSILNIHEHIEEFVVNMKDVLEVILRNLTESPFFDELLWFYNVEKTETVYFDEEDGSLFKMTIFDEDELSDMGRAVVEVGGIPSQVSYLGSTSGYRYIYFERILAHCLVEFLVPEGNTKYIARCLWCENYFIKTRLDMKNPQKFCRYNGDDCRNAYNNRKRIESGEAAEYKRKKRKEGAKPSYYG